MAGGWWLVTGSCLTVEVGVGPQFHQPPAIKTTPLVSHHRDPFCESIIETNHRCSKWGQEGTVCVRLVPKNIVTANRKEMKLRKRSVACLHIGLPWLPSWPPAWTPKTGRRSAHRAGSSLDGTIPKQNTGFETTTAMEKPQRF